MIYFDDDDDDDEYYSNLVFVLRSPEKLRERPGGHGDEASLTHPPQTEQQLLNLTSTFSSVSPQRKRVAGSHSNPELSSRALLFISEFTLCTV